MSDTVKKESTRKKSASGTAEKAEKAAKATVEETKTVKTTAKKTAASKKTKVEETVEIEVEKPTKSKKTATKKAADEIPEEVKISEETEPVKKATRGRKPKNADSDAIDSEKVESEKIEENSIEAETNDTDGETPVPKRKYTKRKTAAADVPETESEQPVEPVKKAGRKSKKEAEAIQDEDDSEDIEEKVFNLIKNSPEGVYQNEVWKTMNIDSRKCSRILKKLLDSERILREEAVISGTKTFLLKKMSEGSKKNYDVLMVKDMFSPCTGCIGECRPEYCPALTYWIMNISENPKDYYAAMGYNDQAEPENIDSEFPPEFIEEMEAGTLEYAEEEDELVFE